MKIIRYFNMQPGLFLQLTVLWWIRLHLLYAASKIGFGAARLLRVLLIPSDLPNGLRIYLRWNRQIEKKKLEIHVSVVVSFCVKFTLYKSYRFVLILWLQQFFNLNFVRSILKVWK